MFPSLEQPRLVQGIHANRRHPARPFATLRRQLSTQARFGPLQKLPWPGGPAGIGMAAQSQFRFAERTLPNEPDQCIAWKVMNVGDPSPR